MKKTLVFATVFLVTIGMVSAVQGHDGADDRPSITNDAPGDQAPDQKGGGIADVPGQAVDGISKALGNASGQALDVLNTISSNSGQALGDALSSLLGDQGNETTTE